MKPKRVGTYTINFEKFGLKNETHPVYEYRGLFISRSYGIANTPSSKYFEIHRSFKDGVLSEFDYGINNEEACKTLSGAATCIDHWLDDGHLSNYS